MSFEEEALKFMQKKQPEPKETISFKSATQKEALFKKLSMIYENATSREIEHTLEAAFDKFGEEVDEKEFFTFIRVHLED